MKYAIAILLTLLFSIEAYSQSMRNRGGFKSTKIGATLSNYAGSINTSFAEGSPGYGVEVSVDNGSGYFRYFFRGRFNQSIGRQNFIKGTTVYNSEYEFFSVEPEIGLALYPVQRQEKGMNLYLWGSGSVSYNYLNLKDVPTTVSVDPKGQALGYGFGGGVGLELLLGGGSSKGGSRHYLIYTEIGFRQATAQLAGQREFDISGMNASVGVGF